VPLFHYTAMDMAGKRSKGTIEAADTGAVVEYLHGQQCLLLRASEVGKPGSLRALLHADLGFKRGLSNTAVAQFTRELSVMLEAGQDIDRALRFLVETSSDKTARRIMQSLRDQVRGGKALAASMAEHSETFSRLYISLVRAGEASGRLAASLSHLADLLERNAKLTAAVQSALIYPVLLVVASAGTIALLLVYVVPQFTPIFEQAGAQLPVQTRILIELGDVLRAYGGLMLAACLGLGLLATRLLKVSKARLSAERFVLKIPIVGSLMQRADAARDRAEHQPGRALKPDRRQGGR